VKRRTGSRLVNCDFFDQYLVLDPLDPTKGWGIFANIGLADQAANPVRWFLNLRVRGERPLPGRSADSFGVGLAP
jgi:porin